jgi:hypothetical protein
MNYFGDIKMTTNWQPYEFLLGDWEGGHEGDPRQGHGIFSFSFDLDRNILVRKNRTVFPTTKERPGYTHDDLLIFYTEVTGLTRAIYFDNEDHVIHYEVSLSPDEHTITLVSDPVPSMPQFRFIYIKTGENDLLGRFEMTPPGQPGAFFTYLEGTSHRLPTK